MLILKLEKKLKSEIEAWEGEQGREFLVNGQKFMQYVAEQWELYHIEKEREKQERVSPSCLCWRCILASAGKCLNFSLFLPKQHLKKSKQTEEDMLYGTIVRTPTKRRFLGTTTPNKSRKVGNLCLRCIKSLPPSFVLTSSCLF